MKKIKILYFSYDGVLEPLGQSQIMNYQKKISSYYDIFIVSYEKYKDFKNTEKIKLFKSDIKNNNITWFPIIFSYKYKVLSYLLNYIKGLSKIFFLLISNDIKIIHCRGYVTFMIIYLLKFFFSFKIVFDMRGFWIDERVEWNIWKKNRLKYKFFKFLEKKLLISAQSIITLTDDARNEVIKIIKNNVQNKIFETIHTCVDKSNFKKPKHLLTNKSNKLIFCHLGAISTRYDLDRVFWFINEVNKYNKCQLLIINQKEKPFILDRIKKNNIDKSLIKIISLNFNEVPNYLEKIDFGIFFPKKGFYLNGFFPTKFAEFIASKKPIVTSKINNDFDKLMKTYSLGLVLHRDVNIFSKKYIDELLSLKESETFKINSSLLIKKHLDVKIGINKYLSVYDKILNNV